MSNLELPSRSLPAVITEAIACVSLNITSIIGNSLVYIAAYRNTNLRSTTNLYIIALAVSDLLCGTVEITLASATLIMEMGLWRRFMPISRLYRYVHLSRDASNTWFDSN